MSARYLVTGGGGFVGANLVRKLLKMTGQVWVLVHPGDNLWRLEEIKDRLTIVPLDIADAPTLKKVVRKVQPDYVFHLAAYGTYPAQRDFQQIFNANTLGTAHLLEALNPLPYKAFVMTGSSSEYGYKDKPMVETDVLAPNSFYSATKGGATLIAQGFAAVEQKPTIILRLFSIYGPWEEPGRLIPTAITKCLKGENIQVTSGRQVRDFVYIDDVVDALLLAAKKAQKLRGEIFNVGSGKQTEIVDIARKIIGVTKSSGQVEVGAYTARPWDATSWQADTRKSHTQLGWTPKTSLEQGIRKTSHWLKNHLEFYL